jgi:large subunit ribosomal protein L30
MVVEKSKKVDGADKQTKAVAAEKPKKPDTAAKQNTIMISIKQIGSPIRRDPRQQLYLKSLGLGKLNRVRQVVDNASTRGLLDKLRHMVVVVD